MESTTATPCHHSQLRTSSRNNLNKFIINDFLVNMSKTSGEINKIAVAPSVLPSLASKLKLNRKSVYCFFRLDKKIALYTPEFYLACAAGGALSCGLTHTLVTPLDLVKCRRQVIIKIITFLEFTSFARLILICTLQFLMAGRPF